jgi:hypothetical protein
VPSTGLTLADQQNIVSGFTALGYRFATQPNSVTNPMTLVWHTAGGVRRFRLWAFLITGGGGGPTVRSADEFRIQITNGPAATSELDQNGFIDLVIGYVRSKNVIVAYDRRWMETWVDAGSNGSPSIQVKEAEIDAALSDGFRRLTKETKNFTSGRILTMRATLLPAYLQDSEGLLMGTADLTQGQNVPAAPTVNSLKDFCESRGFTFSEELLARYVASVITKPFVILAGVSGTGKSKLAELVAEFYSSSPTSNSALTAEAQTSAEYVVVPQRGSPDPARFALVPVRPDWIDNQSVLGFVNPITNKYESTVALDLILRALQAQKGLTNQADAPKYFMLLDEMNLAKVEHYFSDWLACTESRRPESDGTVKQQPVPLYRGAPMTTDLDSPEGLVSVEVPSQLSLPTNLIVTGTVNVDETTYGFSPKVLDRSMVIEFDEVNLSGLRGEAQTADASAGSINLPEFLPPFSLATAEDYKGLPMETHQRLVDINNILEEARLHFGYRSANEIARFLTVYSEMLPADESDTSMLRALDIAILQKVLPRIQGNRAKIERPLERLCIYLRDTETSGENASLTDDASKTPKLPYSFKRALDMLQSLREFGFVSFFK